ncbi:MAG TPA: LLM class flavin-dependent oxidoreductase [Ilumatobacteraceae bacterium]|nr:LLM class flavin-dependent oxidoreductase [Ilumatobacteraceae bacterium]
MSIQMVANFTSQNMPAGDFAAEVEALGYSGVSCSDHFFRGASSYPHLWVSLASMACATETIGLSSAFANNLFRTPVEFVQASLSMHQLSGGRFEAGIGAGWLAGEVSGSGLSYPPPPARARRYREAVLIARELFHAGRCQFAGEFYDIDVSAIGPVAPTPPPLAGALGGPWTIRNVAPLLDRVELLFGQSTRAGDLDMGVLAACTEDELRAKVDAVRQVAPNVPIGVLLFVAVGDDEQVAALREQLGDGYYSRFVGSAAQVSDAVQSLAVLGIDRAQLNERVKGSLQQLIPPGR